VGFALPEHALLRALAPDAREAVEASRLLDGPYVNRAPAQALLEGHAAGDDSEARGVWRFFALALWAGEFGVPLA
jgi:hypothetical protein